MSIFRKFQTFRKNFPFSNVTNQEGFVLLNLCTQPQSRGSVRLQSNHIKNAPIIDPNYFAKQNDIKCTMQAIHLSMDLMETKPFRQMNATIHWPQFDQCKNFMEMNDVNGVNDRYLECIIRVGAVTAHHPGGSCSVGKTNKSCIDSRMRVRGVKRLRVIDASTIPCESLVYHFYAMFLSFHFFLCAAIILIFIVNLSLIS